MPHAVTANRLRDGRVVFRTASGGWSLDVADSGIEPDEAAADAILAQVIAHANAQDVLEPYVIEMNTAGRTPRPAKLREAIRAEGPTITYAYKDALEAAE